MAKKRFMGNYCFSMPEIRFPCEPAEALREYRNRPANIVKLFLTATHFFPNFDSKTYNTMFEQIYLTSKGCIRYWKNKFFRNRATLVFLPGLTADRRLFDKQIEYFDFYYNVFIWDAPGHGHSRPFKLDFSLDDEAEWLHYILKEENAGKTVMIGQSMGGYLAQCYMGKFPEEVSGFVSIDSAPLQRKYVTYIEILLLRHAGTLYRLYPWKKLLKHGPKGCAESGYGRELMHDMMQQYDKDEFCSIAGHGFRALAEALTDGLQCKTCRPALLICGERDRAGFIKRYNRRWSKCESLDLIMIKNAGHNSNTDAPEEVNSVIHNFLKKNNI